jgi:hypothetical protein
MKNVVLLRNYRWAVCLVVLASNLFGAIAFPTKASADESCRALLTDLSNYLSTSPNQQVNVIHMTNYQANRFHFGGYTFVQLQRLPNGNLVGSSNRLLSTRYDRKTGQLFDMKQPEPISYFIDVANTTILLSGQYGPYDMTCLGDKFAIVNSWDSLETFTFEKGPIID